MTAPLPAPLPILPVTLPEGAEALLVLRDWLEQHTGRTDLDRMSEWRLVAYGRAYGAPVELVAQAQAETEAPVRKTFDPEELANAVRLRRVRARTGLLVKAQIVLALDRHLEALRTHGGRVTPTDTDRRLAEIHTFHADGPLSQRLVRLAWLGKVRSATLPPLGEGEVVDLCVFTCDAHGVPADDDLPWRLGVLAGRAP